MCRRERASSAAWVFQRLRPGDSAPDRTPHTELEECTMPMKRLPAIALSLALSLGLLAGCGTTAVVAVPAPTPSAAPTEAPAAQPSSPVDASSGEAVKTGLALITSVGSSTSASAEGDGLAQADITLVAVTVGEDGVIDDCVIDAIQSKVNFDAAGQLITDLSTPVASKNERGDDYGMWKASSIGKEWNEQAQAIADYVVGKTIDQVTGIAVTEDGKAGDADLAASVTMSIGGYLEGIQQAVANAQHLGASKGDTLVLTSTTSLSDSKNATAEEDGLAQAYATVGAITMNGDTITSMVIDAVQASVNFDTAGQITTDLTAAQPSKNQLGDDYGMRKASSIGKEWYEQSAGFAAYVTGKTPAEVSGIAVTEDGKAADADLAASVTISIGAFQTLVDKAA